VVSFCGLPRSASEPTPSSLVQRGQDATLADDIVTCAGAALQLASWRRSRGGMAVPRHSRPRYAAVQDGLRQTQRGPM
jgi:hypothetical protein